MVLGSIQGLNYSYLKAKFDAFKNPASVNQIDPVEAQKLVGGNNSVIFIK